jgi:dihydrofolate reductase
MITLVAACSKNRVIGKDNKLPWHLPEDLKHFKSLTLDRVILMGRKTFESIGSKPLPKRTNVVLTRDKDFKSDNILVYNNIDEVLPIFRDIVAVGGAEIYKKFLNFADEIQLTLIDKEFEGDTYFPEIDENIFEEKKRDSFNNGEFDYHFITYKRK